MRSIQVLQKEEGVKDLVLNNFNSMESPAPPHDGHHGGVCDYASSFRSAINDVYNIMPGLTLYEVTGLHGWALSRHRHNQPQGGK